MSRTCRFCSVISAVALLASLAAPGLAEDVDLPPPPADDLETEETREPREKRVDFRLSLTTELDDNILHLRDDALDELESGDFAPDRFLIDSADDLLVIPSFDLAYSLTPETRKRSRIRLAADVFQYMDNSIKDYEQYRLTFEQDLSDARVDLRELELLKEDLTSTRFRTRRSFRLANRSRLRLSYLYGPDRYQGQLTDDDGGGRRPAIFSREGWDARYYQRLNRGEEYRWRLLLRVGRDDLDYNAEFDERDSERDRVALGLDLFTLRPDAYWQWGLTWELAERRSNTALIGRQGPAGTIEDDLSYDADVVTLLAGRTWYRARGLRALYKGDSLVLVARFGEKDYITRNRNDRTHFGRDDEFLALRLAYTRALSNDATVGVRVEYAEQETNLDPAAGFDRLEPSDFDNLVLGARLSYYTGWKSQTRRGEAKPYPPAPEPAAPDEEPEAAEELEAGAPEAAAPEADAAPVAVPPVDEERLEDREAVEPDAVEPDAAEAAIADEDAPSASAPGATAPGAGEVAEPAGGRIFELQLGLFHHRPNAVALVDDLTGRGHRPYLVAVKSSKGETRYTVRLGPYRSMEQAAAMAAKLRADEDLATVIRFRTPAP